MKGSMFKSEPKTRQHLKDDYRDPEPPPLPPVFPYHFERDECTSIGSLSMKNVLSDPWLVDHLNQVGYWGEKRIIQDVEYILSQRETILDRAAKIRERKNIRIAQTDTGKALEKLAAEGFNLTHEIMSIFIERDQVMLDALKNVLSGRTAERTALRNSGDSRLFMNVLEQWETAYKEKNWDQAASKVIYLAWHLQNRNDPTYYWLIYELYHIALKSCKGGKTKITEALSRYLFGKFLIEKAQHYKEAAYHLRKACEISYGHEWTTAFLTKDEEDHIHNNSNYLLHVVLIKLGIDCSYRRPLKAVSLVKEAVRVVKRASDEGPLADAYFDLAVVYNRVHMPKRAIVIISKALELYVQREDGKNICLALLFGSHCLRRLNDYNEAVKAVQSLISQARHYKMPSLEAKGFKHLSEYYLGRGKFSSAHRCLEKSYKLLEKCDLKDELDEVIVALNYTQAWLRIHDVYHSLIKAISNHNKEFFDFTDFVELGVPSYTRTFPLKFVYKTTDFKKKTTVQHENPSSLIESLNDGSYLSELLGKHINLSCEDDASKFQVPEYYAFSDMINCIHDEELEQAENLFQVVNIDKGSDIAISALKKVPFKYRSLKRSITYLACLEITAAQLLGCHKNGLYYLALMLDRDHVKRKLHLVDYQIDEISMNDYEKKNENKIWTFSVEVQPKENLDIFNEWKSEALKGVETLKYTHDSPPKAYEKLLKAMLPLANIYRLYDQILKIRDELINTRQEVEGEKQDNTEITDTRVVEISESKSRVIESVQDANPPKPAKICRCKEI